MLLLGLSLLLRVRVNLLECSLVSYSSRLLFEWDMPDEFDRDDVSRRSPANPNVWTHGGLISDKVSGASSWFWVICSCLWPGLEASPVGAP